MKSLLAELRALRVAYRWVKSPGDDLADVLAALAFTLGALAFGASFASNIGGLHG